MTDPSEIVAARQALGRLLARYRKAAGLNQHQLAPCTHYGRSTIANVEVGRQNVSRDFWERCDSALNAGGRLLAASDSLDASARRQQEKTTQLADAEHTARSRQPSQQRAVSATVPHFLPAVMVRLSSAMLSPLARYHAAEAAPTLDYLTALVTKAWELRQRASYTALGEHLTVLIPGIESSATSIDGGDRELCCG